MEPHIQYAKTNDGVNIAYTELGEGSPLIFAASIWGDVHLASAGAGLSTMTDSLVQKGWRVVLSDGRGMGSSDRSAVDSSLDARLLDLEAVVEAVGADRFALCGRITGGPAAIAYAARYSHRVSHLVLVNSFAKGVDYLWEGKTNPYLSTRVVDWRPALA